MAVISDMMEKSIVGVGNTKVLERTMRAGNRVDTGNITDKRRKSMNKIPVMGIILTKEQFNI